MKFADRITDELLLHQAQLFRYEAALRREALAVLDAFLMELAQAIRDLDPTGPRRSAYRQLRLERLFAAAQELRRNLAQTIAGRMTDEMKELAEIESITMREMVNAAAGTRVAANVPDLRLLHNIVVHSRFEDKTIPEWWGNAATAITERFKEQMRIGWLKGETVAELVRRVRGADGVGGIAHRHVTTLVRTMTQFVSNQARQETFQANPAVTGVQAVATFDNRTSLLCMSRSGGAWDKATGKPLPESPRQEDFPGPPPWHMRCRTILVPIVRAPASASEGLRRRFAGQIRDERTSYEEWLKGRPVDTQQEILGEVRWELWRKGQIGLAEMTDQKGREIPVKELLNRLVPDNGPLIS